MYTTSTIYSLLFLSLMLMSSCSFTNKTATKLYSDAAQTSYDVIIVPGVPLENNKWSRTMKGRVLWAVYLYRKGIAKNVMFSGSAVYTPYVEAEVMAKYGAALGIAPDDIFTEPKAEHSTENIYYGYKNAMKLGFETVALATDPFQAKMLRNFSKRKIDGEVGIIPIVFDSLSVFADTLVDPILEFDELEVENFQSIKERESFWKRFKGTSGRNIDKSAYN